MNDRRLYWSPAVRWKIENETLKIEVFRYEKEAAELFPKFYFLTQDGISEKELEEAFPQAEENYLRAFIKELIRKKILVGGLNGFKEIFFAQKRLLKSDAAESVKYVKEDYEEFKRKTVSRVIHSSDQNIELGKKDMASVFEKRRSVREFDHNAAMSFASFSALLQSIGKRDDGGFFYPSAGGLYPVDTYVFVKEGRIEGIDGGFYYYDPGSHALSPLDTKETMSEKYHFVTNKEIFRESAASIFLAYNGECNMPRYDGNGYFFGIIDMGAMMENLYLRAAETGTGICSIGDMDFGSVEKILDLGENVRLLHDMEIGIEERNDEE